VDSAQRGVDVSAAALFPRYQAIDAFPLLDRIISENPGSPRRGFLVGTMTLAKSATAAPSASIILWTRRRRAAAGSDRP
jgi:hypothetical protein